MKPALTVILLVSSGAAGALFHHLTEPGTVAEPRTGAVSAMQTSGPGHRTGPSREQVDRLAERLLSLSLEDADLPALDDFIANIKPEEMLPVLRELARRGHDPLDREKVRNAGILEYAAAVDPRGLLSLAMERGTFDSLETVVPRCFRKLPGEVLAAIRSYEAAPANGDKKKDSKVQSLFYKAFASVEGLPPVEVLAIAERHGLMEEINDIHSLGRVLAAFVRETPAQAMEFAEKYPGLRMRTFITWGGEDIDAALAWLKEQPDRKEKIFGKPPELTELDPAFSFREDGRERRQNADILRTLLRQYAMRHPLEAGRFMEQTHFPDDLVDSQLEGIVNLSGAQAVAWMEALPENLRRRALPEVFSQLERKDPEQAAALGLKYPEAFEKNSGGKSLILRLAENSPAVAVKYLQSAPIADAVKDQILPDTVSRWLITDTQAALDFIDHQLTGEVKGRLLFDASQLIKDGDGEAAREFVMALSDPKERLGASKRYLNPDWFHEPLTEEQKARNDSWIASLPDEALRKTLLTPPPPPPSPPAEDPNAPVEDPFSAPQ